MLDLLKKIGVPATVAAVIATLVTITPFLFKIDERYAKSDELEQATIKTSKQIQDLTVEVSKLAGVQETMLALMAQQDREQAKPTPPKVAAVTSAPVASIDLSTLPPTNAGEEMPKLHVEPKFSPARKQQFEDVSEALKKSQQKLEQIQKY